MEVPGALLTLFLFTSCTAVPLPQDAAATKPDHEELASLEASSPAPHPPAFTQAPESANSTLPQDPLQAADATLATLQYPLASSEFFDKGVATDVTTTSYRMGPVSKDVTTVRSGEEDLLNVSMEASKTHFPVLQEQATTQGFMESDEDLLDYELSSLKNKPADRFVTVPDTTGGRSSMAATTEKDGILKKSVQLVKPTNVPSVSDPSVVHIDEASMSTPNAFLVDEEVTMPMSSPAPTVSSQTNNTGVHFPNGHFMEAPDIMELTSKVRPSEEPSAKISAIQNNSEVQNLMHSTKVTDALALDADAPTTKAVESTAVAKTETVTKRAALASSDDFQQAFALSTLASSEQPDTGGDEDVELQLESLVITKSPTVRPSKTPSSTKKPLTANFTNVPLPPEDDDVLTRTAIAQSNTLNESSQLAPMTDMPPATEDTGKATVALSTRSALENTSLFGTEQPDVQPEQQPPLNSSIQTTTVIALEQTTVPIVHNHTSQAPSEDESSSVTLPFSSPPLENMKPNATAGTAGEPIREAGTALQELNPVVYNTSVQTSSPQVDSATIPQPTSTISILVTSNISLGATLTKASESLQVQIPPYLASTPEQEKTSTQALNPSFSDEIPHTEVSKEGFSGSTQSTTYTSLNPMLISESSNNGITFSLTYAPDATTQEFNAENTTAIAPPQNVGNETVINIVLTTASSVMLSTGFADHDNDTGLEVRTTSPINLTELNVTRDAALKESTPNADTNAELANTTAISAEIHQGATNGSDLLHQNESTLLVLKQSTSIEHELWMETEITNRELETAWTLSGITQASVPSDLPDRVSDAPATQTTELTSAPLDLEDGEQLSSYAPLVANDTTPSAPTPELETSPTAMARDIPEDSSASPAVSDGVPISVAPEQAETLPTEVTSSDSSPPAALPTRVTTTAPEPAGPEYPSPSATPPAWTAPSTTGGGDAASSPTPLKEVGAAPGCVPLEPPRSPTHEFRLVFNTSAEFSWEQVEALERRIQRFARDDVCPRRFARTAFALGPPHVLSWTDPSANASWCDRAAVDALLSTMRADTGHPTPEVTRAFYPEFKVVAVELRYRGACATDRRGVVVPVAATAVGVLLSAALVAGLATLLWRALRRLVPSRSRKLDATAPSPAAQPSFDLKERRPILLPGENRAAAGANGTPSKSPHTKPNPPFVVDTDFCYINPNFLEVVKPSPPPPPPYRRSLDRRVRSLEAVLPAPPPRPPHGPHATLGNRSLRNATPAAAEQDEGTSSSSGVESDAQPSGEAKSNESS